MQSADINLALFSHSAPRLFDCLLPGKELLQLNHRHITNQLQLHRNKTQLSDEHPKMEVQRHKRHSTLTMTAFVEQTDLDLSDLDGLIVELGKTQNPMRWFRCAFNEIRSFNSNSRQTQPLLSEDEQSFVDDVLDKSNRWSMMTCLMSSSTTVQTNKLNGTSLSPRNASSMPCHLHTQTT